jgi:RimJ/RimL family protein N-acetyltransferase
MWIYYLEGSPRYGHLINHPCRVVHGMELFERMRLGIHYDPTGQYIRDCLENGPSFVCEVDGEPVCWSCTHLNGQPGMIYTPPEHRRHGYARSLAAFQIDHMLKEDGIAHCFVLEWNKASQGLLTKLGASRVPEAMVWRHLGWHRPRCSIRRRLQRTLAAGRKS